MSEGRWEPVERTGYTDDRGGLLRVHTDDDGTQYISATSSEITESGWVKMPDTPAKLRLCRAVPLVSPAATCSTCGKALGEAYCDHCGSRYQFCDGDNCNYILSADIITEPVAAPEPNEDREPSWRDYETLTLHDLAWLREAAEEYEWAHRNDASVDIDRIRMVIRRIHKAGEARNE